MSKIWIAPGSKVERWKNGPQMAVTLPIRLIIVNFSFLRIDNLAKE